ncbi:hypothetical protein ASPZODRAFT_1170675 [Penicilliopsis zonata CBS 506.65]|uniref:LITAF domain-containing protein n=1 Tax=Penicilliopsis zonata CBS 506.65 TaxID=1073090 RepID=A0A1L9S7P3_9EURO|nr:hypothetical protein ASPZODRAFT_1170675 [Penicilliopsis zonata CBS 506.65]OJJ43180.1 hypothetical protein ASPZODRAFT_1170675 [Penicilliopsis zonata CBS 506.65]
MELAASDTIPTDTVEPVPVQKAAISPDDTKVQPPRYEEHKKEAPAPFQPQRVELTRLGEMPGFINCPTCKHDGLTRVSKESSSSTKITACLCCLFGGVICVFLPFCMQLCYENYHYCSYCGQMVAIVKHNGEVQVIPPTMHTHLGLGWFSHRGQLQFGIVNRHSYLLVFI